MEILIYILLFFPFLWLLMFDQQKLNRNNVFIRYLMISIAILVFGVVYDNFIANGTKSLVYFGSQMTLIFLVLYKIIRVPYYMIYKREPEISRSPNKRIDIIPTLIIITGTMILPFLIDSIIVQKIMK